MIKKYFRKLNKEEKANINQIEIQAQKESPRDVAMKVGEDESYDIMF